MAKMWTKADVFNEVHKIRELYDIRDTPVDAFSLAKKICNNLLIEEIMFKSHNIGGILYRGKNITKIGLNHGHNKKQQNLYCCHELIHYLWHDNGDMVRVCNSVAQNTDSHVEWQANEGTSELLMPYCQFIPDFVSELFNPENYGQKLDFCYIPTLLANRYRVTPMTAEYRINDLIYETSQYIKGTSIDNVRIVSKTKQLYHGVNYGNFESMVNAFDEMKKMFIGDRKPVQKKSNIFIADGVDRNLMKQMETEYMKDRQIEQRTRAIKHLVG